ncbi:MAG: hypothetical protein WD690_20300 [Vicinamibacterales bacterium]
MTTAHDLLVDPILSWRDRTRRRAKTTLPGVLARLASGDLEDFPRVRTHQLDPWCMFLTQLAAIALRRAGESDPRISEERWREMLLALTDGDHDAWSLAVEDLSQPAFFQPPVPERRIENWTAYACPDDIDVLATAKAHDVKRQVLDGGDVEAWVYAIVTLQTMQGVYGAGKYGIARMKGGYACRPRVGLAADETLRARFRRDVQVLLSSWPGVLEAHGYREDGVALVWAQPWDGTASLQPADLTPHFIEICRRLRCRTATTGLECLDTTSRTRRCLAATKDGDVGDPWLPIQRSGGALNIRQRGFRYQMIAELLSESEYEPSAAQRLRPADGDPMVFTASALARGEGGTDGLHSRTLVLTGSVRRKLGEPDGRATLGRRATERIAAAATMRQRVLYRSLQKLTPGHHPIPDSFDACIDEMFFDHLFATLDIAEEDARLAFEALLAELAWRELQKAINRAPGSDARKLKAISDAERMFLFCVRKRFPDAAGLQTVSEGAPA